MTYCFVRLPVIATLDLILSGRFLLFHHRSTWYSPGSLMMPWLCYLLWDLGKTSCRARETQQARRSDKLGIFLSLHLILCGKQSKQTDYPNCLHTAFRLSSCFFNNFYCVGCFRKWFTLSQLLTIRGSINTSIFQVYKSFHFVSFELFKRLVLTRSLKQSSVVAADGNYNSNFCGVPRYSHSPKICMLF